MSDKPSPITGFWVFNELSNGNGNGNGNGNNGNNGNSSKDNNGNNGNSGNNGNNGKNSGNDNGNGKDNGNHNGNGKGDNGKHLGWYKKAQKPKLHGKSPNTTDNGTYEVTNYINDVNLENPQVLMTSDENGTYTSAYTYGLDRISVSTLGITDDKYTPLYYQYDGRGSVTGLVGNADNIEARYSYDAFGVPKPGVKLDTKENGFINSFGFNGEENDTYSGLQYLRARYYESDTGRFLTRDSYLGDLMNPLTLNRYDYTSNNPVMYTDPSGHRMMAEDGGGATAYAYSSAKAINPKPDNMDAVMVQYSKTLARTQPLGKKTPTEIYDKVEKSLELGKYAKKGCGDLPYLNSQGTGNGTTSWLDSTKPVQLPGIVQKLIGGNEIPSTGQLITNVGSTAAGSVTGTLIANAKNIEKKVTGFVDKFNVVTPVPYGSILTTKPYKTLGEVGDIASKGLAGTSFLLDAANTWTAASGNTNLQRIEKTGIQFAGAVVSYGVGQLSARMAAAGVASSETGVGALLIPAAVVVDGAAAYGIDKGQNYLYNKLGIK